MTDYLSQAMEQDGEDREEVGVDLLSGASRELPRKQEGPGETDGPRAWRPEEEETEGSVSRTVSEEVQRVLTGAVDRALEPGEAALGAVSAEGLEEELLGRGSALAPQLGPEGAYTPKRERIEGSRVVYRSLVRSERAAGAAHSPGRRLTVTLPEAPAPGALDAQELDRAVERDARRYDGGFWLY